MKSLKYEIKRMRKRSNRAYIFNMHKHRRRYTKDGYGKIKGGKHMRKRSINQNNNPSFPKKENKG